MDGARLAATSSRPARAPARCPLAGAAVESRTGAAHLGHMNLLTTPSRPGSERPAAAESDGPPDLEPDLLAAVMRARDWLVTEGVRTDDSGFVLTEFALRLNGVGL